MIYRPLARSVFLFGSLLLVPVQANAWFFFFLPGGLFSKDVDPSSIEVSDDDRVAGKCAGFHVNQTFSKTKSDEEKNFHSAMSDKALESAADKVKTKELAEAYSGKWGKAAQVDKSSDRAYGADLASGCRTLKIPLTLAQQQREKKQEEVRLQEEARQQEAARRLEDGKRQVEKNGCPSLTSDPNTAKNGDRWTNVAGTVIQCVDGTWVPQTGVSGTTFSPVGMWKGTSMSKSSGGVVAGEMRIGADGVFAYKSQYGTDFTGMLQQVGNNFAAVGKMKIADEYQGRRLPPFPDGTREAAATISGMFMSATKIQGTYSAGGESGTFEFTKSE